MTGKAKGTSGEDYCDVCVWADVEVTSSDVSESVTQSKMVENASKQTPSEHH